jgi:hypothetical protein
MRGRVMSFMVVAIGGMSTIGAPLVGWFGEVLGARFALAQGGIATLFASGAVFVYLRSSASFRSTAIASKAAG